LIGQKPISLLITGALIGKSVPASVCLDSNSGFDTKEVEEVNATRILAAELELIETTIAEHSPQTLLRIS
jgi:hypothetical protein